jgi:hypothetical protein
MPATPIDDGVSAYPGISWLCNTSRLPGAFIKECLDADTLCKWKGSTVAKDY